jgi:hypothetical protein
MPSLARPANESADCTQLVYFSKGYDISSRKKNCPEKRYRNA